MRIIVTGGAGFIGSNLILHILKTNPKIDILNIDKLTYASDITYLDEIKNSARYHFKKMDLVDRKSLRGVMQFWKPEAIIHLAAESHVDNSIKGPEPFVMSNLVGTFNLVEEFRLLWQKPDSPLPKDKRFLHVSTDEVYGTLGDTGAFTETTPYAPNSPYSATKAGSDLLVRSYHHTFGLNTIITNCSNNFGPHQHEEKLIPTVIRKALAGEKIPVYGTGQNIRDWLWVEDHCNALLTLLFEGKSGEQYNIGGDNEWKNIELVETICELLNEEDIKAPGGDFKSLISHVKDRPGHDYRYAIDASKIKSETQWEPSNDFKDHLKKTVRWYMEKFR